MKKIIIALSLGLISLYAKPVVTTSILPTAYFVEQIAGDSVEINVMVGVGADPHSYEPKPAQMKLLEKSDLFFSIGIEFDKTWSPKFAQSFPKMKIVQTQVGIEFTPMSAHHEHSHAHHDHHSHDHHHGKLDPHVWLDPVLVGIQAKNIAAALIETYPQNKAVYEANLAKFEANLRALDAYAKEQLSSVKNKAFIVYHPSWGYFARRYGLEQIAVEVEGKEPKPAQLAKIIEEAKEEGVKVVFVAPQFSKKSAQIIAEQVGAKVVEIDQLPRDWESAMRATIEAFKVAL